MKDTTKFGPKGSGRRSFLKKSGIAVLGTSLTHPVMAFSNSAKTNATVLKVGLIGCGGRGTGAAAQALHADPNVHLTAMGDVFTDRLETAYSELLKIHPDRIKVDKANKFIGFDAYQKVIASDVDVVLLTTPPSFRPGHLAEAVKAGKHVFCEKPVAVDAPGVRSVLESAKIAKDKQLSLMSGFCFRHNYPNQEFFGRILKGDLGSVRAVTTFRHGGEAWYKERQPDWTQMTYEMRNWYYYNWLSGDFIVEQAVHSIDMMSWAMNDIMPIKATGHGGRQVRVDPKYGNIYDHFAIEYEYADGAKGYHFTRQQADTSSQNSVEVFGSEGTGLAHMYRQHEIKGRNLWTFEGENNDMFQTEHDVLFKAIRDGNTINDGEKMAHSTLLAIMGRMVGYTGQTVTWEEAFNSTESLGPKLEEFDWNLVWETPAIAIPGKTKLM